MLENLSADEIVSHIHSQQITPEEVVTHYLNRIKKFNPSLKAIVSLKEEEMIIKETKHLAHTDSNKEKLLFGLPLAIKDLFNVKGLPTTYGLSSYKTNIPKKNSIIVDRLIEQGAIIIGKTKLKILKFIFSENFSPSQYPATWPKLEIIAAIAKEKPANGK